MTGRWRACMALAIVACIAVGAHSMDVEVTVDGTIVDVTNKTADGHDVPSVLLEVQRAQWSIKLPSCPQDLQICCAFFQNWDWTTWGGCANEILNVGKTLLKKALELLDYLTDPQKLVKFLFNNPATVKFWQLFDWGKRVLAALKTAFENIVEGLVKVVMAMIRLILGMVKIPGCWNLDSNRHDWMAWGGGFKGTDCGALSALKKIAVWTFMTRLGQCFIRLTSIPNANAISLPTPFLQAPHGPFCVYHMTAILRQLVDGILQLARAIVILVVELVVLGVELLDIVVGSLIRGTPVGLLLNNVGKLRDVANLLFNGQAPTMPVTGLVKNKHGICLRAPALMTKGVQVQMGTCNAADLNQQWEYSPGVGQLRNRHGLCVRNANGGTANGGLVDMWTCDPNDEKQQWTYGVNGWIRHKHGACLNAPRRNQPGWGVWIWACTEPDLNEQWAPEFFLGSVAKPVSGWIQHRHGVCLDASGGNVKGGRVQMWTCIDANPIQQWKFDQMTGLVRSMEGHCLHAPEPHTNVGVVQMWPCDPDNMNQKWVYNAASGHLRARDGGCLHAPSPTANGWHVELGECNEGNVNLQWTAEWQLEAFPTPAPVKAWIKNRHGLCLDAPLGSVAGGRVQMWECYHENTAEQWSYDRTTGLVRSERGNCLAAIQRHINGGVVRLSTCDPANETQTWDYIPGTGALKSRDGICLDAPARTTNGHHVQTWACLGNENQQWDVSWAPLVPKARTGRVKNRGGLCLHTTDGGTNGARIQMAHCNDHDGASQWTFDHSTGMMRSLQGLCLDSPARTSNGGLIHLWACDPKNGNQIWDYNEVTGRLKNRNGICVDVGLPQAVGHHIQMWTCHEFVQQQWDADWFAATQAVGHYPATGWLQLRTHHALCLHSAGSVPLVACAEGWSYEWTYHAATGFLTNGMSQCLNTVNLEVNGQGLYMDGCNAANTHQQWDYDSVTGRLKSRHGSKCVDIPNVVAGQSIRMWDCLNTPNQQWAGRWTALPSGLFKNRHGLCLHSYGHVHFAACSEDPYQQWRYDQASGRVSNLFNQCLDTNHPTTPTGLLFTWPCLGDRPNQRWDYDVRTGRVKSRNGLCMDAHSANLVGRTVQMWHCWDNHANQQWDGQWPVIPSGLLKNRHGLCLFSSGYVHFVACSDDPLLQWRYDIATGHVSNLFGVCLESHHPTVPASAVVTYYCDEARPNQQWSYDAHTGRIKSRHGLCMDAHSANLVGRNVQMWHCWDDYPNQQWDGRWPAVPSGLFKNRYGLCMDTPEGWRNRGLVQMWHCMDGNPNQQWRHDHVTGMVTSVHGHCLDTDAPTTTGGSVYMWPCNENNYNQRWAHDRTSGLLKNKNGICLHAPQRGTAGQRLQMWPCDGANKDEQWDASWLAIVPVARTGWIRNLHGLCLDTAAGGTDGGAVYMWHCIDGNSNQHWLHDSATGLVRSPLGKCLDTNGRNTNGAPVYMYACNRNNLNQQWEYDVGTGRLKNRNGKCVDAPARNTAGHRVQMWACLGNDNQQWDASWFVVAPTEPNGWMKNRHGLCIETPQGDVSGGTVRMWPCARSDRNMQWTFDYETGLVRNSRGHCLDAPEPNIASSSVQMWVCSPHNRNQQWVFSYLHGGQLKHRAGLCLDALSPNTVGHRLQIQPCSGSEGQQWDTTWSWVAPTPHTGVVHHQHGTCLDTPQGSVNGGRVQMWECIRNNANQQWKHDSGSGLIRSVRGHCLDTNARTTNGAPVYMYPCDANNQNQQWDYDPQTGQLKNRHGICIDAPRPGVNGHTLVMWVCHGGWNQQWDARWLLGPSSLVQDGADGADGAQDVAVLGEHIPLVEDTTHMDGETSKSPRSVFRAMFAREMEQLEHVVHADTTLDGIYVNAAAESEQSERVVRHILHEHQAAHPAVWASLASVTGSGNSTSESEAGAEDDLMHSWVSKMAVSMDSTSIFESSIASILGESGSSVGGVQHIGFTYRVGGTATCEMSYAKFMMLRSLLIGSSFMIPILDPTLSAGFSLTYAIGKTGMANGGMFSLGLSLSFSTKLSVTLDFFHLWSSWLAVAESVAKSLVPGVGATLKVCDNWGKMFGLLYNPVSLMGAPCAPTSVEKGKITPIFGGSGQVAPTPSWGFSVKLPTVIKSLAQTFLGQPYETTPGDALSLAIGWGNIKDAREAWYFALGVNPFPEPPPDPTKPAPTPPGVLVVGLALGVGWSWFFGIPCLPMPFSSLMATTLRSSLHARMESTCDREGALSACSHGPSKSGTDQSSPVLALALAHCLQASVSARLRCGAAADLEGLLEERSKHGSGGVLLESATSGSVVDTPMQLKFTGEGAGSLGVRLSAGWISGLSTLQVVDHVPLVAATRPSLLDGARGVRSSMVLSPSDGLQLRSVCLKWDATAARNAFRPITGEGQSVRQRTRQMAEALEAHLQSDAASMDATERTRLTSWAQFIKEQHLHRPGPKESGPGLTVHMGEEASVASSLSDIGSQRSTDGVFSTVGGHSNMEHCFKLRLGTIRVALEASVGIQSGSDSVGARGDAGAATASVVDANVAELHSFSVSSSEVNVEAVAESASLQHVVSRLVMSFEDASMSTVEIQRAVRSAVAAQVVTAAEVTLRTSHHLCTSLSSVVCPGCGLKQAELWSAQCARVIDASKGPSSLALSPASLA